MEDHDCWAVKRLLQLLMWNQNMHQHDDANEDENGDDDVTAICLFDLGEFVGQYPNGRVTAKRLGAKPIETIFVTEDKPRIPATIRK